METTSPQYTTSATAKGGRNGTVRTDDGILDLKVSVPKAFGGEEGDNTNPEQLFAAGWAACFDNALLMTAQAYRAEIESRTTVEVTLGPKDNGNTVLSAVIKAEIKGVERDKAQKILDSAHKVCPYSVATRDNIDSEVQLIHQ